MLRMYQINATNTLGFVYSHQLIFHQEDEEQANKNCEVLSGWTAIYKFTFVFEVTAKIADILEQKELHYNLYKSL